MRSGNSHGCCRFFLVRNISQYSRGSAVITRYEFDEFARDGGPMSYGADSSESFERAAALVARIFNEADPGDLPFELPTRYPLMLNLKTAKATGLENPPSMLALADEVIRVTLCVGARDKVRPSC